MRFYSTQYTSPIGKISIVSNGTHIIALWLETQAPRISAETEPGCRDPIAQLACRWLDAYFAGMLLPISDLPLNPSGTAFQRAVWERLCCIPHGTTVTYGELAHEIAAQRGIVRMSAQAVGQAVGANPVAIIIPCHRVIGSNGKITGYDGGIDKKMWLLKHEGVCINDFPA